MIIKLTDPQGLFLLKIARNTIAKKLNADNVIIINQDSLIKDTIFQDKRGVFITIHKDGHLRGCIGNIEPEESIIKSVKNNAINAAFKDPRFSPLKISEFNIIDLEISILTIPEKLNFKNGSDLLSQIKPSQHGVIVKSKNRKATFLPQVWDQLPKKEEFLSHLCIKAGLSSSFWEKELCEILTYNVQYFKEGNPTGF